MTTLSDHPHPRVGLGLVVLREDRILLAVRKSKHDAGTWSAPGGHLEFGESFEACAARELQEEVGDITVSDYRISTITNDLYEKDDKHYVTIIMVADYISGEPVTIEPDKFEEWRWFPLDELPTPLILPLKNAFASGWDPRTSNLSHESL